MTLQEAKDKYKNCVIKEIGFLNGTQLIYKSEILGKNRTKRNLFLIEEILYYLSPSLKEALIAHQEFNTELPNDITYESERYKIPLKYFNEMEPVKAVETLLKKQEPIEIQKKDNSIITNTTSQPCANLILNHFNEFIKNPQVKMSEFIIEIVKYASPEHSQK